ncbi:putative alcohol oxidase [Xylariaceae sp. FL1651]|nr:putative alcohol oxidase [Xylariaceae sp. FL1651]
MSSRSKFLQWRYYSSLLEKVLAMSNTKRDVEDVDIIFAGGGTAACVAAGRLAQAAPHLKILIIEQGKNNLDDPTVVYPALFAAHLGPTSTTALFYRSEASSYVGEREVIVPAGGMLGGGSSINLSMYTRAQSADYDSWDTPGWTAKEIVPLCDKAETYDTSTSNTEVSSHGTQGPVQISSGGFRSKCENDIMDTLCTAGMKATDDINDFSTTLGFMRIPRYVSIDGKRQDAAHCYVHPQMKKEGSNIRIVANATVKRVLFDNTVSPPLAVGVEYVSTAGKSSGSPETIMAKKFVIVAAGALGSPQILERSGIGNEKLLNDLGINVVSNLPGVGENYQDHHFVGSAYVTSLVPDETLDAIATGRKAVPTMIATNDPQLGWNGIDVAGKIRPEEAEAQSLGPEFYELWKKDWSPNPQKPMMLMNFIHAFVGNPADVAPDRQHLTIGCISLYPYSRGSIHVTDTQGGSRFDSGFLSHEFDVKKQIWAYKRARSVARKLPFFDGEVAGCHPSYPAGSAAAVVASGKNVVGEPVYSPADDEAVEKWVRNTVGTTWHSLGTCAMKPRESGGVVDAHLNVYGTRGLKVADLSIAPKNIGANVGNTAFAIGEKVALIIAEELGF